jgi:hypothetical protein
MHVVFVPTDPVFRPLTLLLFVAIVSWSQTQNPSGNAKTHRKTYTAFPWLQTKICVGSRGLGIHNFIDTAGNDVAGSDGRGGEAAF